jgi:hypothetical protein
LLFVFFACLSATAREGTAVPHVVPAKVGLVLIGATQDGFALATDGSSLNADGRVSQEQKIFPLGKNGALALAGTVSIQDPIGARVREEVNIVRIAGAWAASHPDADLQTANRELNSEVSAAVNKFSSTRDPGVEHGQFKFSTIIAGFSEGKPILIMTTYFLPTVKGKLWRTEQKAAAVQPGDVWIFGNSAAATDAVNGKLKVKDETGAKNRSIADCINLFDVILTAAESPEGRKRDGKRAIVAAPNRFASVSREGFSWSKN